MTITQNFFIDVLNTIKKEGLFCKVQSSDDELINAIKKDDSVIIEDDYSAYFPLNDKTKKILIDTIIRYHSEEYIHYFEIKEDDKPLFVAYDGFEIADIVAEFQFSENFIEQYVRTGLCIVLEKIIYPCDQLKYNIQPVRIML